MQGARFPSCLAVCPPPTSPAPPAHLPADCPVASEPRGHGAARPEQGGAQVDCRRHGAALLRPRQPRAAPGCARRAACPRNQPPLQCRLDACPHTMHAAHRRSPHNLHRGLAVTNSATIRRLPSVILCPREPHSVLLFPIAAAACWFQRCRLLICTAALLYDSFPEWLKQRQLVFKIQNAARKKPGIMQLQR